MGLLFPKKKKYVSGRQRRKAEYRKKRPGVREAAWTRDGFRCVFPSCGRLLALDDAHIHETTFRSAGGDATDINIAVTTCQHCHSDMHVRVGGKRKRIEGSRSEGFRFYQRVGDEWREVLE